MECDARGEGRGGASGGCASGGCAETGGGGLVAAGSEEAGAAAAAAAAAAACGAAGEQVGVRVLRRLYPGIAPLAHLLRLPLLARGGDAPTPKGRAAKRGAQRGEVEGRAGEACGNETERRCLEEEACEGECDARGTRVTRKRQRDTDGAIDNNNARGRGGWATGGAAEEEEDEAVESAVREALAWMPEEHCAALHALLLQGGEGGRGHEEAGGGGEDGEQGGRGGMRWTQEEVVTRVVLRHFRRSAALPQGAGGRGGSAGVAARQGARAAGRGRAGRAGMQGRQRHGGEADEHERAIQGSVLAAGFRRAMPFTSPQSELQWATAPPCLPGLQQNHIPTHSLSPMPPNNTLSHPSSSSASNPPKPIAPATTLPAAAASPVTSPLPHNTAWAVVTSPPWQHLLNKVGVPAMVHLLSHASIFVPLGASSFVQVAGPPVSSHALQSRCSTFDRLHPPASPHSRPPCHSPALGTAHAQPSAACVPSRTRYVVARVAVGTGGGGGLRGSAAVGGVQHRGRGRRDAGRSKDGGTGVHVWSAGQGRGNMATEKEVAGSTGGETEEGRGGEGRMRVGWARADGSVGRRGVGEGGGDGRRGEESRRAERGAGEGKGVPGWPKEVAGGGERDAEQAEGGCDREGQVGDGSDDGVYVGAEKKRKRGKRNRGGRKVQRSAERRKGGEGGCGHGRGREKGAEGNGREGADGGRCVDAEAGRDAARGRGHGWKGERDREGENGENGQHRRVGAVERGVVEEGGKRQEKAGEIRREADEDGRTARQHPSQHHRHGTFPSPRPSVLPAPHSTSLLAGVQRQLVPRSSLFYCSSFALHPGLPKSQSMSPPPPIHHNLPCHHLSPSVYVSPMPSLSLVNYPCHLPLLSVPPSLLLLPDILNRLPATREGAGQLYQHVFHQPLERAAAAPAACAQQHQGAVCGPAAYLLNAPPSPALLALLHSMLRRARACNFSRLLAKHCPLPAASSPTPLAAAAPVQAAAGDASTAKAAASAAVGSGSARDVVAGSDGAAEAVAAARGSSTSDAPCNGAVSTSDASERAPAHAVQPAAVDMHGRPPAMSAPAAHVSGTPRAPSPTPDAHAPVPAADSAVEGEAAATPTANSAAEAVDAGLPSRSREHAPLGTLNSGSRRRAGSGSGSAKGQGMGSLREVPVEELVQATSSQQQVANFTWAVIRSIVPCHLLPCGRDEGIAVVKKGGAGGRGTAEVGRGGEVEAGGRKREAVATVAVAARRQGGRGVGGEAASKAAKQHGKGGRKGSMRRMRQLIGRFVGLRRFDQFPLHAAMHRLPTACLPWSPAAITKASGRGGGEREGQGGEARGGSGRSRREKEQESGKKQGSCGMDEEEEQGVASEEERGRDEEVEMRRGDEGEQAGQQEQPKQVQSVCEGQQEQGGGGRVAARHVHAVQAHRVLSCLWVQWVLAELVIPVLRSHFYVTESEVQRHTVCFYRKPVWARIRYLALQRLASSATFHKLTPAAAKHLLLPPRRTTAPGHRTAAASQGSSFKGGEAGGGGGEGRALGVARVRFVPKAQTVRPIVNLGASSHVSLAPRGKRTRKRARPGGRDGKGGGAWEVEEGGEEEVGGMQGRAELDAQFRSAFGVFAAAAPGGGGERQGGGGSVGQGIGEGGDKGSGECGEKGSGEGGDKGNGEGGVKGSGKGGDKGSGKGGGREGDEEDEGCAVGRGEEGPRDGATERPVGGRSMGRKDGSDWRDAHGGRGGREQMQQRKGEEEQVCRTAIARDKGVRKVVVSEREGGRQDQDRDSVDGQLAIGHGVAAAPAARPPAAAAAAAAAAAIPLKSRENDITCATASCGSSPAPPAAALSGDRGMKSTGEVKEDSSAKRVDNKGEADGSSSSSTSSSTQESRYAVGEMAEAATQMPPAQCSCCAIQLQNRNQMNSEQQQNEGHASVPPEGQDRSPGIAQAQGGGWETAPPPPAPCLHCFTMRPTGPRAAARFWELTRKSKPGRVVGQDRNGQGAVKRDDGGGPGRIFLEALRMRNELVVGACQAIGRRRQSQPSPATLPPAGGARMPAEGTAGMGPLELATAADGEAAEESDSESEDFFGSVLRTVRQENRVAAAAAKAARARARPGAQVRQQHRDLLRNAGISPGAAEEKQISQVAVGGGAVGGTGTGTPCATDHVPTIISGAARTRPYNFKPRPIFRVSPLVLSTPTPPAPRTTVTSPASRADTPGAAAAAAVCTPPPPPALPDRPIHCPPLPPSCTSPPVSSALPDSCTPIPDPKQPTVTEHRQAAAQQAGKAGEQEEGERRPVQAKRRRQVVRFGPINSGLRSIHTCLQVESRRGWHGGGGHHDRAAQDAACCHGAEARGGGGDDGMACEGLGGGATATQSRYDRAMQRSGDGAARDDQRREAQGEDEQCGGEGEEQEEVGGGEGEDSREEGSRKRRKESGRTGRGERIRGGGDDGAASGMGIGRNIEGVVSEGKEDGKKRRSSEEENQVGVEGRGMGGANQKLGSGVRGCVGEARQCREGRLGASVFGYSDAYGRYRAFVLRLRARLPAMRGPTAHHTACSTPGQQQGEVWDGTCEAKQQERWFNQQLCDWWRERVTRVPPVYMAVCDVAQAYDTIPHAKLLEIMQEFVETPAYIVRRFSAIAPRANGLITPRSHRAAMPMPMPIPMPTPMAPEHPCATVTPAVTPVTAGSGMARPAADEGLTSLWHRDHILQLLRRHISCHVIRAGRQFFLQRTGIPQGSVLSALLCSLFYAHLDRHVLLPSLTPLALGAPLPPEGGEGRSAGQGGELGEHRGDGGEEGAGEGGECERRKEREKRWEAVRVRVGMVGAEEKEGEACGSGAKPVHPPRHSNSQQQLEQQQQQQQRDSPPPPLGAHSLLLRLIDDSLFISTSQPHVAAYVAAMHTGFQEYGCRANQSKTAVNFPLELGKGKREIGGSVAGGDMDGCGRKEGERVARDGGMQVEEGSAGMEQQGQEGAERMDVEGEKRMGNGEQGEAGERQSDERTFQERVYEEEVGDGGEMVQGLETKRRFMRWAGLLVNCSTLEVQADYTRYWGTDMATAVTVSFCDPPATAIPTKLRQFLRPKCSALLLDPAINSSPTLFVNAYQALCLAAIKLTAYCRARRLSPAAACTPRSRCVPRTTRDRTTHSMGKSKSGEEKPWKRKDGGASPAVRGRCVCHVQAQFFTRAIIDAINYYARLIRSRLEAASREVGEPIPCLFTTDIVTFLGLSAFTTVLNAKRGVWKGVVVRLQERLRCRQMAAVGDDPVVKQALHPSRHSVFGRILF
ncbi:unnamed protein product [Closterium sp. NIES-65]|nr:unnamed protein product [Closterium sp. NIES-65]